MRKKSALSVLNQIKLSACGKTTSVELNVLFGAFNNHSSSCGCEGELAKFGVKLKKKKSKKDFKLSIYLTQKA